MKKILFALPVIVLLAAGCSSSPTATNNITPASVATQTPSAAPPTTQSKTPVAPPAKSATTTSSNSSTSNTPKINSFNPASGPADSTHITISGSGFTQNNSVFLSASSYFGTSNDFGILIAKVNSSNTKTLQFIIPSSIPSNGGNSFINPGTYTITVVNANGSSNHKTFTVTASMASSCVINSFTASPLTVKTGGTATLSWNTTNCMNIYVSNTGLVTFNKQVDAAGSMSVSPTAYPQSSATYTIEAHDVTGTGVVTSSVKIEVNP